MPTFHVYSQGQKAEEIVGGNLNALKAACEKYGKASQVFQGTGHTLSGQAVLNGYHSLFIMHKCLALLQYCLP